MDRTLLAKKIKVIESMFHIADKDMNTVPFVLNDVQRTFGHNLTGRDIIVKARQEGFSSFIEALFLLDCMFHENTRAVVIAHDKESTQRLFNRVKFYIKTIKGPAPSLQYDSRNEITFPKTNSTFYVGTAGSRQFGRGDTINRLHCSEVGFWETGKDILAGLLQAVPRNGMICLESTGNGVGNFFHKRAKAAEANHGSYRLHFFGWQDHKEYKTISSEPIELDDAFGDEQRVQDFNLSNEQMRWYIEKRADMMDGPGDEEGYKLFKQEYPTNLDEAFQFSGGKFFTKIEVGDERPIPKSRRYETRWKNPKVGHDYTIGVDMGGGVGLDHTVIEVVDITAGEQVLEWRSNFILPEDIGPIVAQYGKEYNTAFVVPESNNHGNILVTYLKTNYNRSRIFRQEKIRSKVIGKSMEYGWFTSDKAKFHLCDHGRAVLQRGFTFYSRLLEQELLAFEEKESEGTSHVKKLCAASGEHDDSVIAFMLALYGVPRFFNPARKAKAEVVESSTSLTFDKARQLAIDIRKGRKSSAGTRIGGGYTVSGVV